MGGHFWDIATWMFLCSVRIASADRDLEQELGLNIIQDFTKVNVSQDEYTRKMNLYLNKLREAVDYRTKSVPDLLTFDAEIGKRYQRRMEVSRLRFPKLLTSLDNNYVEQVELRLLMPPSSENTLQRITLFQIVGNHRRRFLGEHEVYLSKTASKWCEMDLSSVKDILFRGNRSFGLELQCSSCSSTLHPVGATLNVLVHTDKERVRRAAMYEKIPVNCSDSEDDPTKQRCCRHNFSITFKQLRVPHIRAIKQPISYEAGYCKGRCPYNYNHASNHSRLQSLVHKLNRKVVPRPCCVPSKLAPITVLRLDNYDHSTLNLEVWENMRVLECLCS